ncbi:MAG: hypothetical protein RLZZ15_2380 [Verrucomicrobiota bacterium]|jgi:hypothetical protein
MSETAPPSSPRWTWLAAVAGVVFLWWLWPGPRANSPAAAAAPSARRPNSSANSVSAPPASPSSLTAAPIAPPAPALDPRTRALLDSLLAALARRDTREREAVLTFADDAAYRRFLARARDAGLVVLDQLDALRSVRVRFENSSALTRDLVAHAGDFADASANFTFGLPQPPAKEARADTALAAFGNRALEFLGATGDRSAWGRGTTIAVLDTGIAPDATFGPARLRALDLGYGIAPGNGPEDGHGTAVAALAAGASADAPGPAPAANLLSLRVTDATGTSDIFTLARGIVAATDAGANILNISLGGYATNSALDAALAYATARGVVIVAAAGNDQAAQLAWPAADPRVISVGAIDALGQQVTFSNSGPQLSLTAPGYGVQTAWLGGQRALVDGTSASSPLVAGAIAAVLSTSPGLTPAQAAQVLLRTASDAGAPGDDPNFGNGILNLGAAQNRDNPAYADPAIASHYFDAAAGTLSIVVQNRGAQTVAGLLLELNVGGLASTRAVPLLAPGATHVVPLAIDPAALAAAAGGLRFSSELKNPPGLVDQNPANNRRTSTLTARPPGK